MIEDPNTNPNPEPNNQEPGSVGKKTNVGLIIGLIVAVLVIIGLVVFIVVQQNEDSDSSSSKSKKSKNTTNTVAENVIDDEDEDEDEVVVKDKKDKKDKKKTYGLGDTFEWGDYEIKVGDKVSFDKVDNEYSDLNGKEVVKLPITVTNNGDESKSFSTFYLTYYGSKGTEITESVEYLIKDSISSMGSLRSGATNTANICIVYDGDGTYAVELDDWEEKATIEFDVEK